MRVLAVIGALAILIAVGAAVFFFGGYYSVAGTSEDAAPVAWALERVRLASIRQHATTPPPIDLSAPATIQSGARAFMQRGCFHCHGGPGVEWSKFSEGMRPDPPDLKDVAPERSPEQLFWVVKNGINMTGMPSFARVGASDDEIWKIAAFVKQLPKVSEADFKRWTATDSAGGADRPPTSPP